METNSADTPNWLIVGAGIGGLTLAAALAKHGHSYTVFEQQHGPSAIGAGIAMAPNAMHALSKIDLAAAVTARGEVIKRAKLYADRGRSLLSDIDLSFAEREYGVYPVAIHRNELLEALRLAAGEDNIRYGFRCSSTDQSATSVTAQFENGEQAAGTGLIGADGIHSVVLQAIAPKQPLNYHGFVSWRGIAPNHSQLVAPATSLQAWGPGTVFGVAPVSKEFIYWYGTRLAPSEYADAVGKEEALTHFADWATPIPAIIDSTPAQAVLCHAIYDRDPLPGWSKGRIAVLGDAAHAMPPNMGQGGAQAILDAVALAKQLQSAHNLEQAYAAFQEKRLHSANNMVRKARQAAKMDHLQNPLLVFGRDMLVKFTPTVLLEQLLRPDQNN